MYPEYTQSDQGPSINCYVGLSQPVILAAPDWCREASEKYNEIGCHPLRDMLLVRITIRSEDIHPLKYGM